MMGGFLASRVGGGGGSVAPDGTLPQYTTMSALDAALTTVGRRAQLVGATTGEVILTCGRVAAGAGGLAIEGPILLWQADGTEFDGAFAWVALAGASITWGVAGDAATGGLVLSVGYAAMGGFRALRRDHLSVRGRGVAVTLPISPATGDGMCVGAQGVAGGRARLGGFGYSVANPRAAASNADTASATPTLSLGSTNLTVADGVAMSLGLDCPWYGGTSIAPQGSVLLPASDTGSYARTTAGAATGGGATDYRPIFWARNMTARFTELFCGEFAA